jgi:hypothetical protein
MAQIKGTAIRGLLKQVKESGHAGGIPAILAELPPASHKTFDHRILASGWYPYDSYGDLLTVVHRRLHGERSDDLVDLGRWLAKQDAGTTLKIFALFASVETMLQRGQFFWPRHCDTGTFVTVDVQKGSGVGMLSTSPASIPCTASSSPAGSRAWRWWRARVPCAPSRSSACTAATTGVSIGEAGLSRPLATKDHTC